MKIKRFISLALVTSLCLTGCGKVAAEKVELVPQLTVSEVKDYYAKNFGKDMTVERNNEVHEVNWVEYEVNEDTRNKLEEKYKEVEKILGQQTYNPSIEESKVLTKNTWNYVKTSVDGLALYDPEIIGVKQALGFYFVDVSYKAKAQESGNLTQFSKFLGLKGAFKQSPVYGDTINTSYLKLLAESLNSYYLENEMEKKVSYKPENGILRVAEGEEAIASMEREMYEDDSALNFDIERFDEIRTEGQEEVEAEEVEGNTESQETESTDSELTDSELTDSTDLGSTDSELDELGLDGSDDVRISGLGEDGDMDQYISPEPLDEEVRSGDIDFEEVNEAIGFSNEQQAFMPELSVVYKIPEAEGTICGFGIYPIAKFGLVNFGLNQDRVEGTVNLRYVFKDDMSNSGEIIGTNVYVTYEEMLNGVEEVDETVLIPEYIQTEFEKLIERADRAEINDDLFALASGKIYTDLGVAIQTGHMGNVGNVVRRVSDVKRVLKRDTINNEYLVEVETLSVNGAKGTEAVGTYSEIWYYVIKENDENKFVITDRIKVFSKLDKEPEINPDSAVEKRLAALNLGGDISDTDKASIENLLNTLYFAGTHRALNSGTAKYVDSTGNEKVVEVGMKDCFDSDTSLLSSERKEYLLSSIMSRLTANGNKTEFVFNGHVTSWVGGNSKQAEVITEEIIEYKGYDSVKYMQCYYTLSNINDKWVIDDIKILEEEDLTGNQVSQVKARFNS